MQNPTVLLKKRQLLQNASILLQYAIAITKVRSITKVRPILQNVSVHGLKNQQHHMITPKVKDKFPSRFYNQEIIIGNH